MSENDAGSPLDPDALKAAVDAARSRLTGDAGVLHYLSVPPSAAADVVEMIGEADLAEGAKVVVAAK